MVMVINREIDFARLTENDVLDLLSSNPKYCTVDMERAQKSLTNDGLEVFNQLFKRMANVVFQTHGEWTMVCGLW